MGNSGRISGGLNLIYIGSLIAIVSMVCAAVVLLVPLLALLLVFVGFVGGVVSLVGLAMLRNEHGDYMNALVACVLGIVFGLLSGGDDAFATFMNLGGTICALLQVYFVVRGTNSFLRERGCLIEVAMGDKAKAWRWQLISAVAGVVAGILTAVTLFAAPGLSIVLVLGNLVVSIAALVFYLSYLRAGVAALS